MSDLGGADWRLETGAGDVKQGQRAGGSGQGENEERSTGRKFESEAVHSSSSGKAKRMGAGGSKNRSAERQFGCSAGRELTQHSITQETQQPLSDSFFLIQQAGADIFMPRELTGR